MSNSENIENIISDRLSESTVSERLSTVSELESNIMSIKILLQQCRSDREDSLRDFFSKAKPFGYVFDSIESQLRWRVLLEDFVMEVPGLREALEVDEDEADYSRIAETNPKFKGLNLPDYRIHVSMLCDAWNSTMEIENLVGGYFEGEPMVYLWNLFKRERTWLNKEAMRLLIEYTKDYNFSILPSIEEACENLNGIIRYGQDFTIIYLNFFVIRIYSAAPPIKREEMLTWLSNSYEEETKDGSFTDLSEFLESLIRVSGLGDRDERVKYLDKESYDLVQYAESKRRASGKIGKPKKASRKRKSSPENSNGACRAAAQALRFYY